MDTRTEEVWLTPREAATRIKVNKATIHRYIERGILPAAKFGTGRSSPLRIRAEDVDALLTPVLRGR